MQKNNEKYYILDILKFIMSLFIILLHSTNTIKGIEKSISLFNDYPIYYILSTIISRFGVPCFFIISGFLFFNKIKNIDKKEQDAYYIKYSKRNLLYWFIASLCYLPFLFIVKNDLDFTVNIFIREFIFIGACFHLWYLLGVVIAITIVFLLYRFKIKNFYIFIFSLLLYIIGFIGNFDISFLEGTLFFNFIKFLLSIFFTFRNGIFVGTIFIFIGKYLSEFSNFEMSFRKKSIYILFFLLFGFLLFLNVLSSGEKMNDIDLLLIPLSFILIRLLLSINIKSDNEIVFNLFRRLSFYVYLIHPYIYFILFISINNINENFKIVLIGILNIFISLIISLLFLFYKKILKKTRK